MDQALFYFMLCDNRYSGNIGSTARVLKNFGFNNLTLLNPRRLKALDALKMAGGAVDLIEKATVVNTLMEALTGMEHIVGFSRRKRGIQKPVISPNKFRELLAGGWRGKKVALLFGSETFGLLNTQIEHCEKIVTIPTSPHYPSLNLSHSVAIICYEISTRLNPQPHEIVKKDIVPFDQRNLLYTRFQALLKETGFFKERNAVQCMIRIKDMFERSCPDDKDYKTMMGIIKVLEKKCGKTDSDL